MAERDRVGGYPAPTEQEVRELVRRVVDAVGEPSGKASAPEGAPDVRPTEASGAARREQIAIGSDHGGFRLKEFVGQALTNQGYALHDCGTTGTDAVDYPDFAHAVARLVADGRCRWGIAIDGAGIGSCIVANKVPGVRAALCHDVSTARNSREHNHANVLTLGARLIGEGLAMEIVDTWLATPWGPGRHAARVDKITEIERLYVAATASAGERGSPEG